MESGRDTQNASVSPLLHRAVRNSVFTGLGSVSTFVVGFVFAGLTIRYLGEARAGYLLALQAVIGLSSLLGGFGLGTPSIRRIAILHNQDDLTTARGVVGSVATVNIGTGLLLSLLIILFFPTVFAWTRLDVAHFSDAFWATLFVSGSFLLAQMASSWQAVYEALQRYDLVTGLATAFGLLSGAVGIVVLTLSPTMSAIASAHLAIGAIRLGCDAYLVKRLLNRVPMPTWKWNEIRSMLGFGGWTYLGSLGIFLFTNADRLILTTFLGSAALPYYAVPQRLYLQIHGALTGQSQFLFPMLSAFGDEAAAQIERVEDRLRWFVALLSGMTYTLLTLVGTSILSRLVSPAFARQATLPLVLACLQGFCHAQMIVPYYSIWAVGDARPNSILPLMNGILVIATSVVLIPRLGFVGASLAQLWVVVIVIVHTFWVRRIISPQLRSWNWLSTLISPSLMILTWLLATRIGIFFLTPGPITFGIIILIGGVVGLVVVWLIEHIFFPKRDRWITLLRALEIMINRIKKPALAQ